MKLYVCFSFSFSSRLKSILLYKTHANRPLKSTMSNIRRQRTIFTHIRKISTETEKANNIERSCHSRSDKKITSTNNKIAKESTTTSARRKTKRKRNYEIKTPKTRSMRENWRAQLMVFSFPRYIGRLLLLPLRLWRRLVARFSCSGRYYLDSLLNLAIFMLNTH